MKERKAIPRLVRRLVRERAGRRCEYCQHPVSWSEDSLLIIGRTAIGRATVEALKLNRQELIELRHALYAVGKHPPAIK
jgi:5-methylcytosine-specific restriction endonuclease McrA